MTKQKHKSKLYLFSLGLLPLLMMGNISGENLLKNIAGTSEPKAIIAQTGLLADGYYRYKDDSIGVEFGDRNSGETQSVTFLSAPATEKIDNYSRPKSISWKIIDPSDQNTGWLQKLTTKIANNLGGRFATTNWKIDGDQAVLHEVLPDVDLRYKILPGLGLKEELIVKGAKEQVEEKYSFNLVTEQGLKLQKASEDNQFNLEVDSYYFTDTRGNYVAHFLPLTVYDSNGQSSNGASLDITNNGDNDFKITITVDHDWLYSVDRQYPIFIDPTIVHDDLTDFNTGNAMNRVKAVAGPKVQLENQELAADVSTVGLWHMNETSGSTVTDFSGNGNNGTATGTTIVDGKLDKARGFNGTSDLINLGKNPSIKGSSQVTIEGWVYPTSLTNYFPIYFESNNTSGYTRLMLNIGTNGALNLAGRDTDGTPAYITYATSATGLIATNKWYHVAGVYNADTDTHRVYINGIDVTSSGNVTAASFPNTAPADDIYLGFATGGNYASGTLDEIRLTKRALSIEEIKADASLRPYGVYTSDVLDLDSVNPTFNNINWTENGVRTSDGETDLSTASLVAQWNFNETSGTTASVSAGSCGTSCNGTLTNMTTTGQDVAVNSGWTVNNKRWGAGALMFDGSNDYVDIAHDSNQENLPLTISTWVKSNQISQGNWKAIISKYAPESYNGWNIDNSNGSYYFYYYNSSSNYINTGTYGYSFGTATTDWTNLVAVVETTGLKLYSNGKLVTTGSWTGTAGNATQSNPLRLGGITNGTERFNGIIDATAIYNRALSADEILSNYQAGNVQLQTRTGTDDTPDDGSWEEWRPSGSGTESALDSMNEINQPNSISGLAMWLKADSITGLNDDDAVSNWPDSSGNNRYAAQSTSSYQPIYKTNVLNGQPAIRFDGADDALPIMDSNPQSMTSISMFIVHQIDSGATGTSYYPLILGGDGNTTGQYLGFETQNSYSGSSADIVDVFAGYGNDARATLKNEAAFGSWKMWSTVSQNTVFNTKMYVNGAPATMSTTGTDQNLAVKISTTAGDNWGNIGGTRYSIYPTAYKGDIAEVLIYNRALSDTERRTVEQYLANKYNLNTSNQPLVATNDSLVKQEGLSSTKLTTGAAQTDANTVGLWHLDETGGSGAYIKDSSGNGNNGTPTGVSVTNGISGKGKSFNGSSDYITVADSDSLDLTTDGTIETWAYFNTINNTALVARSTNGYFFGMYSTGKITWGKNGVDEVQSNATLIPNKWYHLAVTRTGGINYIYINGVLDNSATKSNFDALTSAITIGGSGWFLNGKMDEIRISNTARTANEIAETYRMGRDHRLTRTISSTDLSNKSVVPFYVAADKPGTYLETTIGESAFANYEPDSDTVLFLHGDESNNATKIIDSSNLSNTITTNGNTVAKSNSKIGNSIYFDGSGDYLSIPTSTSFNMGTNNFSISFWNYYLGSSYNYPTIVANSPGSWTTGALGIRFDNTGQTNKYSIHHNNIGDPFLTSTNTFTDNTWHYVSLVRESSTTVKLYVDGLLQGSATISPSVTFNWGLGEMNIGRSPWDGSNGYYYGYVDELRIDDIAHTADEIRQAYEIGSRTHAVTIDFAASLDNGNLISDSSDTSFTIDATQNGLSQKGSNLFVGDKIIVRENYDGTEYVAQGLVDSVNISTGAVTISSWDSGATFPSGGYTIKADVFKWQREYFDITSSMSSQRDAVTHITTRFTNGSEGHTIWLDDFKSVSNYLTNPIGSTITSSPHHYFQYRLIPTTTNIQTTPSVAAVTLDYEKSNMTISGGSTTQTSLNNSNKQSFDITVTGVTCDEVDTTITAQVSWNQVDWYEVDQTISPVTNLNITNNINLTTMNGYPATEGNVTFYLRAQTALTTSNTESLTILKDTVNPIVANITSVAGDINTPFNDTTNNGSTLVVYATSDDANTCKWDESDLTYGAMSHYCESTTNCTLNLTGYGDKDVYMRCKDNVGNENNDLLSPTPTFSYTIGGISMDSAVTDEAFLNNNNKNNFGLKGNNVIYETTGGNVVLQGSWNQADWYDVTTVASPVNGETVSGTADVASWNGYPADGDVTVYLRVKGGTSEYSEIRSFLTTKDTTEAGVTGIVSVAGDSDLPFVDPTNNLNTQVLYTASADAASCKWDTNSALTFTEMTNTCEGTSSCTLDLEGRGNHTVYFKCQDIHGNNQTNNYTLTYSINSSSEQPLGWLQTREIKIDPATPLDDYQVRVELTPTTFDYDNTKSDGSDIKFYDDNDTKLEYWTEESDNRGTSVFWVKVPVGGTEKIYLYYGNYSGTNESNYDDVFSKNNNTSGLVAGWHLDDVVTSSTVSDYSGNNNTGTLTNGPVWVETDGGGWADQSDQHFGTGHHLSFDGNDDYINVPHSTIVDPQTAWTLETWVNRNYLGSQNSLIEKYAWTSGTGGYAMRITADNKLNGFIVNGTAAQACTGTTNIMNGEWYHVAVTFDSTTDSIRCYVNGLLDGYNNAATYNSMSSSSVSLKIGARGNDAGSVLNGYLDEPRIYSRALSGGEIRSQFERRQYDANGPQTILGGSRLVSESHTGQTDWLDSNWNYRTGLTVFNNNNVDALNDYQVVFNLDTKYLVDSGKVLSSGNDLRFTDSDGLTLLDYFIHTDLNNVNTRIFIKIPEVGADSQKKIYMYYGNPSAEVASSENALDFYDDFEDGIIDSTKWPTQSTGSYITEENGQIKMIGIRAGNYYLQSPAISSANIHTVIEAQTSTPILPTNGWSPVSWWKSTSSGLSILDHPNTLIGQQTAWHNGLWDSARTAKNVSETHINQLKIKDNFNTSLQTKFSDSYFSDWTVNYFDNSQDSYFIRLGARADNYDPGSIQTMDGRIDWVLARQYTEPEPRVGAYKVAYTSKKGNIESETWYGTIYVEEPVIVNPGATLTIQPGTIIKFNKDAYLLAENSTINAIGLSYDPIYFTSVNDNNRGTIMDNSTGNPAAGDWMGVYAIGNGDNIMKFCDVAYGGKTNELGGINYRGMINVREDDMTIVNTVFNNSANADIFTYQANPYVYRNNLGDSPYGLYIDANNQVITHAIEYNSFANTTDTAVYVDNLPNTDNNSGPGLVLRNNDIDETNTGFYIKNMSGDSIRDNNAENTIDARQNAFKNQVGYMCYFDTAAGDCKFDRTSGGEILFDTNSAILEIPNGDEHWMAGSTQIVSWNFNNGSSNGSYVDIYLSPNNGEEFDFTVAANLRCDGSGSGPGCSGTSGSYNWLVSGVPNNENRLKIVLRDSAGNSLVEDMSDRNFQINLITDELSDVQAGAGAKHTVKFAIPFDWPELVNDSFKISFPAQFDLSELNPGDITASGGDVVWGSPVINSLSNTIVIPFTGTLDDTDGLITFGLGSESNMIINPEENGSYRLTITLHDNQTGVNPAIRRLSTNININDDLAFAFHVPATLQLSIRDITDTMDIDRLRFENPTANTVLDVSHLIKVSTNAHNGYSVTISEDHDLTSPSGAIIPDFVGSNEQPQPWIAPPGGTVNGYYGYRTDDIDLSSGTADRFAVANRWAAAITDPKEIIYYPTSTQDQTNTMTFRLQFTPKQVSGHYQHTVFYTITPNY